MPANMDTHLAEDELINTSNKTTVFVFERVENIVGKGENAGLPAFSPFPTMFSKVFPHCFQRFS